MAEVPEDKAKLPDASASSAGASFATSTPPAAASDNQKSWGDKYKHGVFHFVRNILVNYIVNFAISASLTYSVLQSPLNKHFEKFAENAVKHGNKINMPPKLSEGIANFFSTTQLLLCGGHVLLPYMKYSHDNRNKIEYGLGHKLDSLQESMGLGNAATKRNLAEYKYINDLMKAKPAQLTDDDKQLLAKHNIGDNLQFSEQRQTWGHVLKARATGVSLTTTMSILFGLSGKFPEKFQMETIKNKAGALITQKALLNKIPEAIIKHPEKLGQYAFLELLYTAGSKFGFDHAEKMQLKKQEAADAAAAQAALSDDKKALPPEDRQAGTGFASRASSGPNALKKLAENGEQDFRTREILKPGDPSMAMS